MQIRNYLVLYEYKKRRIFSDLKPTYYFEPWWNLGNACSAACATAYKAFACEKQCTINERVLVVSIHRFLFLMDPNIFRLYVLVQS